MSFSAVFALIENGVEMMTGILNRPRSDLGLTLSSPASSLSVRSESSATKPGADGELCHLRQLSLALNSMYLLNDFNPDVTIVCGNKEFKVHLQVVTAVCPFFESALTKGWKETALSHVDLPTISPDSMSVILRFIYCRNTTTIPRDKDALMKLIEDAIFFQIDDLIEFCYQTLCECHVTNSDFQEVYDFLDRLDNRKCLEKFANLLGENFSEISQSKDFLLLNSHQLKKVLQSMHLRQHCMNNIVFSILKWIEFEGKRGVKHLSDYLNILNLWCPECLKNAVRKNRSLHQWSREVVDCLIDFAMEQIFANDSIPDQQKRQKLNLLLWFAERGEDCHVIGLYDLENGTWIIKSKELPFRLKCGATVSYGHHIYFLGGGGRELEPSTSVIQYCPFTNSVISVSERSLVCPVWAAAGGILNESIYVVNGADIDRIWLKTVQRYDITDGSCQEMAQTNYAHLYPRVLLFKNECLFAIGDYGLDDRFLEGYDKDTDQWTVVTKVPGYCYWCSAAICGSKLFILKSDECQFQEYDIDNDKWTVREFLKKRMLNLGEDAIGIGGKLMLYGVDCKKVFYLYDVESAEWTTQSYDNEYMREAIYITCI